MKFDDDFAYMVLAVVGEIPPGKVLTYGRLAHLVGCPNNPRQVAKVLSTSSYYGNFPCHRVVNSVGRLAPGWIEQYDLLFAEGVTFTLSGKVILRKHLWL